MARNSANEISAHGNKIVTVTENPQGNDSLMVKATDGRDLGYFNISEVSDALGSLSGLASVEKILPPIVGGAGTIIGTLLVRKFVTDKTSNLVRFAPALGAAAGVVCSLPLYWVYGPEGVMSGALTSAMLGGGLLAYQELSTKAMFNGMGLVNVQRKLGAPVASGGGARMRQTANVPGRVGSAMDVAAFGGKSTY